MSLAALRRRPAQYEASTTRFVLGNWAVRHAIVFALVIEFFVFAVIGTNFITVSNLTLVLSQVAPIGIMVVPGMLLILAGYIDFSVGSLASLVAVVVGVMLGSHGVLVACGTALLLGCLIGAVQGVLITVLKFPAIVVTLGFYGALGGVALVVANGQVPNGFSDSFAIIGQGELDWLNIPVPIVICLVAFILGGLFLYRTRWGRHVIAIGSNPPA